jgi:hypothetical protein
MDCIPGHMCPFKGMSKPIACGIGYYQSLSRQLNCSRCDIGTYSTLMGQQECLSCPLRQYTVSDGSTSCIECSNGLLCQDGGAEALPGYWAWLVNQTLSPSNNNVTILRFEAIKCLRDRCKGGPIVHNKHHKAHQCGDDRDQSIDNILCARCENDHYTEWGPSNSCVGMYHIISYPAYRRLTFITSQLSVFNMVIECESNQGGLIFVMILSSFIFVFVLHILAQSTSGLPSIFFYFIQVTIVK